MNLLYCGNLAMFDGMLSSLLSIASRSHEKLDVLILTGDFSDIKKEYVPMGEKEAEYIGDTIRFYNPDSRIRLVDLTGPIKGEIAKSKNKRGRFSPYCLLRLFLDEVEAVPDRLLYLDCDTLALGDIKELFEYDLRDSMLGMAKDAVGSVWLNADYCNSGVLLMDIAKIRETNILSLCRRAVIEKRMFMPDQTALNLYFSDKIAFLPERFNEQKKVRPDTLIRHYCDVMHLWPVLHVTRVKQWDVKRVREVLKDHSNDEVLDTFLLLKENYSKGIAPKGTLSHAK